MARNDTELAPLEEHLLVCAECLGRAEQTREYIGTMKAALVRLSARRTRSATGDSSIRNSRFQT